MQIKVEVSGNIAVVTEKPEVITTGTRGLPVLFTFDPSWEGLQKTAVFRCGKISSVQPGIDTATTVPWEVLKKPNTQLSIGVYGVNADGTIAIPTVWANVDTVKPGADPEAEPATDPALPVYQQLLNDTKDIRESLEQLEADTAYELSDIKTSVADLIRKVNTLDVNTRENIERVWDRINNLSSRVDKIELSGGSGLAPLIVIYDPQDGKANYTSAEIFEASLQRPVLLDHSRYQERYQLNYCNEFYASFVKLGDDRLYEEWIVDESGNVEYFNHGFIANTEQLNAAVGKIEATIGDIDSALDELHAYAQALIGGDS